MYGRQKAAGVAISIHAPREGCDTGPQIHDRRQGGISIHAPREGCDRRLADIDKAYDVFQSTHPVRGATCGVFALPHRVNFNPRTP